MNPSLESPFPLHAVPRVWLWLQQTLAGKFDDFAPKDVQAFTVDWIEQERRGRRSWAVIRDGEIGGAIVSTRLSPVVADLHLVFKREFWGHKTTVPALAEVCADIFGTGYPAAVEKIETKILPENRAALGMASAIGFAREGLARGHTLREGELVDVALVGLERSKFDDWNRRRLQQQRHELSVSEPVIDEPDAPSRAAADGAGPLLSAPQLHDQSASRGEPGAHDGAKPGQ